MDEKPQIAREADRGQGSNLIAFASEFWMLAFALHPLLRFLLLAEAPAEMTALQMVERFLWLSSWVMEIAVIVLALRSGFRFHPFFLGLKPAARLLIAIWFATLAVSTLRAQFLEIALRSALEWSMHGMFAAAAWHLISNDPARARRMFRRFAHVVPWVALATGIAGLWLVYRIGLFSNYAFATDLPGFAHIRHTGYIFAPAMALCVGRLATSGQVDWKAATVLALNTALCLWFGSRGPFFGLLGGLAAAYALSADFRRAALILPGAAAAVVGVALSVLIPSPDHPAFNAIMRFLRSSTDPSEFSSGRTEFWVEAARLIADQPLLGYGGGQFQFVSPLAANMYRHPHDFILQVIFDWGLIGGGAFLGLLGLVLMAALRTRNKGDAANRIGLFAAISMLSFAVLDGILFYPYTIAITVIFLALALVRHEQRPATSASSRTSDSGRRPLIDIA